MTDRTNELHPDYKLLGSTGKHVLKNPGVRHRHRERQTAKDINDLTLHLECLNIAHRSMDDSDIEDSSTVTSGDQESDKTLTELNQAINAIPHSSNHQLSAGAHSHSQSQSQHDQTQIKSDTTLPSTRLRGLNFNSNSQKRYDQLSKMNPPNLNYARASSPRFQSDQPPPDTCPNLTRFPLPNSFLPRGMFRPSSRFQP